MAGRTGNVAKDFKAGLLSGKGTLEKSNQEIEDAVTVKFAKIKSQTIKHLERAQDLARDFGDMEVVVV